MIGQQDVMDFISSADRPVTARDIIDALPDCNPRTIKRVLKALSKRHEVEIIILERDRIDSNGCNHGPLWVNHYTIKEEETYGR